MDTKKFLARFSIGFTLLILGGCALVLVGLSSLFRHQHTVVSKGSLLYLQVSGMILDSQEFLKKTRKYAGDNNIKGVLVRVDSPGGVVGPSQEIHGELLRIRKELQKPVIVSCGSVAASGAYYIAVGASKIITNPGTLMGSIGVIMEFANLENLYGWAKVKRYTIKTGPYKDSGSEYRAMRDDERKLFQELIDGVHLQFKKAVAKGRNLALEKIEAHADGRIFTGEQAVHWGLADQLGSLEDAIRVAGEMSGLGDKPELFEPPHRREGVMDLLNLIAPEDRSKLNPIEDQLSKLEKSVLKLDLLSRPLLLMPGVWR